MNSARVNQFWRTGQVWELFGLADNSFTSPELLRSYATLSAETEDADQQILDRAFSILNAPRSRWLYAQCRTSMAQIRESIGAELYAVHEGRIWGDLWDYVGTTWEPPSRDKVVQIVSIYRRLHVAGNQHGSHVSEVNRLQQFLQSAGIRCEKCGACNHTIRYAVFPFVISVFLASFKRVRGGMLCEDCRRSESTKWALVSLLFGWWSIWGFFWTIGALIDNARGGKMPAELNTPMRLDIANACVTSGCLAEAKTVLRSIRPEDATEEIGRLLGDLNERYPEIRPVSESRFRFGYASMVVLFVGAYVLLGFTLLGNGEGSHGRTTPSGAPSTPSPTSAPPSPTPHPSATPAQPSAPHDDELEWLDTSAWISFDTVRIEGLVTNNNSSWVAEGVEVIVTGRDQFGRIVVTRRMDVVPSTLDPGETGSYSLDLTMPTSCDRAAMEMRWTWSEP